MLFNILITLVIIQRLVEVIIAKKNEKWMLSEGGHEAGASHYPLMILMHSAFFIALLGEVLLFERSLSSLWLLFLPLFLLMQVGRFWCLYTLGKLWNTKIMILPSISVVKKGPYRFLKHPNYVIVSIELLTLPLLFNAYFTAFFFTLLNFWMLSVRIPIEEGALKNHTNYNTIFKETPKNASLTVLRCFHLCRHNQFIVIFFISCLYFSYVKVFPIYPNNTVKIGDNKQKNANGK